MGSPRRCVFVPDLDHHARRLWASSFLAVPDGQGTPKVLEAMGVLLYSVDKADE